MFDAKAYRVRDVSVKPLNPSGATDSIRTSMKSASDKASATGNIRQTSMDCN